MYILLCARANPQQRLFEGGVYFTEPLQLCGIYSRGRLFEGGVYSRKYGKNAILVAGLPVKCHHTYLEYSCTNSTNQIAHCEVSKSHSETSYGVSLLSPQGTVPVKVIVYCQLEIHGN